MRDLPLIPTYRFKFKFAATYIKFSEVQEFELTGAIVTCHSRNKFARSLVMAYELYFQCQVATISYAQQS